MNICNLFGLVEKEFVCKRNLCRLADSICNHYYTYIRLFLVKSFLENNKLCLTEDFITKNIIFPEDITIFYSDKIMNNLSYVFAFLFCNPYYVDMYKKNRAEALNTYLQLCIDLKNKDITSHEIFSHLGIKKKLDFPKIIENNAIYSQGLIEQYKSFMPKSIDSDLYYS